MRFIRQALIAVALASAAATSPVGAMSLKPGEKPDVAKPAAPSGPAAIGSDGNNPLPPPAKKSRKVVPEKKSERPFIEGYEQAYSLIYDRQDYAAGIVTLRSLQHDENPDVANLIGYASRKLGRTEDAQTWYERALAADPKHTRTWQYYGMWQLEMGDRAKAEEYAERIRLICAPCEDYSSLRNALDGNITY